MCILLWTFFKSLSCRSSQRSNGAGESKRLTRWLRTRSAHPTLMHIWFLFFCGSCFFAFSDSHLEGLFDFVQLKSELYSTSIRYLELLLPNLARLSRKRITAVDWLGESLIGRSLEHGKHVISINLFSKQSIQCSNNYRC